MIDGSSQLVLVSGFLRVEVKRLWQLSVGQWFSVYQLLMAGRASVLFLLSHTVSSVLGDCFTVGESPELCVFPFTYQVSAGIQTPLYSLLCRR